MQIVIDIPESIYEEVMSGDWSNFIPYGFCKAIENGRALPKGHGRLIDEDDLMAKMVDFCVVYDEIMETPTIIEADTEREDKND